MNKDFQNAFWGLTASQLGSIKSLPLAGSNSGVGGVRLAAEIKAVEATFADEIARAITATITNRSVLNANGQVVNTGPIVGIVEWGTGGAFQRVEFNLPQAYVWGQNGDVIPGRGSVQGDNGVMLTVNCSSIRVMARNESRLPPIFGNQAVNIGGNTSLIGEYSAFIAQGTANKQCGSLERDLIVVSGNGDAMAPNEGASFGIPRFAKCVRFYRTPLATTRLRVDLIGDIGGSAVNSFFVEPGNIGQIPLTCLHGAMTVTNVGAANITSLTAAFELGL